LNSKRTVSQEILLQIFSSSIYFFLIFAVVGVSLLPFAMLPATDPASLWHRNFWNTLAYTLSDWSQRLAEVVQMVSNQLLHHWQMLRF
jgi:hypothetical protein